MTICINLCIKCGDFIPHKDIDKQLWCNCSNTRYHIIK